MGQVCTTLSHGFSDAVNSISSLSPNRRKRKLHPDPKENEEMPNTPKKMRLESTLKFIYKALFVEGRDSDITVKVLDKEWNLHKMYLQQSPYFASMFSGKWSESDKSYIEIEVTDPNITVESVNVVFSSCYTDELTVDPTTVLSVLAASTLFQMEGLIEQCSNIMMENMFSSTVVKFYKASADYGIQNVKDEALYWLAINLVSIYNNPKLLGEIEPELMELVIRHKDLCVIQYETFLYIVLRMWAYLRSTDEWHIENDRAKACENYFRNQKDASLSFLEREEGKPYVKVFEALKIDHLVEHIEDALIAERDNLLPAKWLTDACTRRWISLLSLIANKDNGPVGVTPEKFDKECLRLGLELDTAEDHSWKWNCFTSGVELVWTVSKKHVLSVERVRGPIDPKRTNSPARRIAVKVAATNLNEKRQVVRREISSIMEVSLVKNQQMKLLQLDPAFTFPLYLQVYLLLNSPKEELTQQQQ